MEGWQIALVVLFALLVGALLPLLAQLYATLHTIRQVVDKSARDVEAAAEKMHRVADRVDRLGAALEKDGRIEEIVDGLTSAAQVMNQMQGTLRMAGTVSAAVVPAVAAAVKAWKDAHHEDPSRGPAEPAPDASTGEGKERAG